MARVFILFWKTHEEHEPPKHAITTDCDCQNIHSKVAFLTEPEIQLDGNVE